MNEINKLNLESKDLVADRLQQLGKIMPEVFDEGGIDFDKLRLLLGGEIDEGDERYAFTWPGKANAIRQSQTSTTATLRPRIDKSRGRSGEDGSFDSDNIYIEGDNLETLKLLQRAYHGKVKMIYIDPPYNTGKDFIYKDHFGDTIKNYTEQTGQSNQSNPETSGRFHSAWCSMMYPRLKLARELLTDDGAIFISIGDNELHNLLAICNEIFGESTHAGTFVWKSRAKPSNTGQAKVKPQNDAEYVVSYSRGLNPGFQLVYSGKNRSYPHHDDGGDYRLQTILKSNRGESARSTMRFSLGDYTPPADKRWQAGEDTIKALYASNHITFETGEPMLKYYEYEEQDEYSPFYCFIEKQVSGTAEQGKKELNDLVGNQHGFDTVKPTALINYLLKHTTSKDDLILDFFSGSATTAQAIMQVNEDDAGSRKWILIQLPEQYKENSTGSSFGNLCQLGEERIRHAGDKIAEEVAESNRQLKLDEEPEKLPDIGFRVFKLDESGIARPEGGQMLINLRKDGRSDLDIIFEVMLKWGYELTYPIEKAEFAGYGCYSVAEGDLVCCMEPGLTVDALEAIADEQPRRVFIMDSVFGHDDSLKLDALAIFRHAEEKTQQKIELRTV